MEHNSEHHFLSYKIVVQMDALKNDIPLNTMMNVYFHKCALILQLEVVKTVQNIISVVHPVCLVHADFVLPVGSGEHPFLSLNSTIEA